MDLNADLGESFGAWRAGDDDALLDVVTSASIACGFHAGDPVAMRRTVRAAAARGVAIGAHPGYRDLVGFGRRDLAASPAEIEADVLYQVGALQAMCAAEGTRVRYVKPHGALYNRAAVDDAAADAVACAVRALGADLALLALAGSALARAGASHGLRVAAEAFADRAYLPDGTLAPRDRPGAVLHDAAAVADRAHRLATTGCVLAVDGSELRLAPDSLCVHGDTPGAVALARAVRERLAAAGLGPSAFA